MKYPRADAIAVARELLAALTPHCARIIVAGSLRRRKAEVGDVEILYVSERRMHLPKGEIFQRMVPAADIAIADLEERGVISRRLNSKGATIFGAENKLVRHNASDIPVDLFATRPACWWNYLVCRTGPAESNIRLASAAKAKGWHWNPYGPGFSRTVEGEEEVHTVNAERDVFDFVGLPYNEPWERE